MLGGLVDDVGVTLPYAQMSISAIVCAKYLALTGSVSHCSILLCHIVLIHCSTDYTVQLLRRTLPIGRSHVFGMIVKLFENCKDLIVYSV